MALWRCGAATPMEDGYSDSFHDTCTHMSIGDIRTSGTSKERMWSQTCWAVNARREARLWEAG